MSVQAVGEVLEKIESSFEWTIPNWKYWKSCITDNIFISCFSPPFQFWDATWNLEIPYNGIMWLCLRRCTAVQNMQVVRFKASARKNNGEEHKIVERVLEFTEEKDTFRFLFQQDNLLFNEPTLDANLTVSCTLYGNRSIENAAAQSISSKSEEDYTKETETQDTEDQVMTAKRGTKDFERLSRHFKELLVTGQNSDVTVKVNDREFRVHKLILGAQSPVFDKMFGHDMVEKKEGIVDIKDCSPDAFKEFLLYLYSGQLDEFSRNTVFDLYLLSDKYDVPELKSASVEFIIEDLCIDTFCDVLHLALQHSESVLLGNAKKFFAKNLKKILVTMKWQSFIKENPIQANELYIKALNDVLPE